MRDGMVKTRRFDDTKAIFFRRVCLSRLLSRLLHPGLIGSDHSQFFCRATLGDHNNKESLHV